MCAAMARLLCALLAAAAAANPAQPVLGRRSRTELLRLRSGTELHATQHGRRQPHGPELLAAAKKEQKDEQASLMSAPPFVRACACFAAADSMLLGYDIGCISGILLFVQDDFGLSSHQTEVFASAMNSAAIFGALVSGFLADRFGRKPALFISSCMFALGSILMAVAQTYDALVFSRYIQGFGVGAGLLISPMFISEVSPKQFRGALVTLSEVSLSLGILLAYIVNFFLSGVANQWRWMIALGAAPDVLLALRMLFLPESPRFLVGKGKMERARQVQRRIFHPAPPEAADAELAEIVRGTETDKEGSWLELFEPATMVAVGVGIMVAMFQHAVGIESIIYYSTKIFQQAGVTSKSRAILLTVSMGLVKLVCETYSLLRVDSVGRRPLLLIGSAGLTAALLVIGFSMQLKLAAGTAGVTAASLGVFGGIVAYMAFHALSYGPITWLVLAEIFPLKIRGKAMGIATMVNRGTSFVVAYTFLTTCERLNWSGSFYLYAALAAASFFFYALFVPETNGMALEEISPLFGKPRTLVSRNLRSLGQMLPSASAASK